MNHRDLSHLCATMYEDDGRPMPRKKDLKRRKTKTRKRDQLCAQIQRSASMTLPTITQDKTLLMLIVDRVVPSPTSNHLNVYFKLNSMPKTPLDALEVQHKLNAITGLLRQNIARDIHRKRVPNLQLILTP